MGNVIGNVYKHSQHNWPYPYPNKTFVLPPHHVSSPKNDFASDCAASMIAHICYPPISNLPTKNKVDTDVNDENSKSSANPGKQ